MRKNRRDVQNIFLLKEMLHYFRTAKEKVIEDGKYNNFLNMYVESWIKALECVIEDIEKGI